MRLPASEVMYTNIKHQVFTKKSSLTESDQLSPIVYAEDSGLGCFSHPFLNCVYPLLINIVTEFCLLNILLNIQCCVNFGTKLAQVGGVWSGSLV